MDQNASGSDAIIKLLGWLDLNKQRLIIGAVIAGIVALIVSIVVHYQVQSETAASHALSEIRLPYSPAQAVAPGTPEAMTRLAEQDKGTKAAARALLVSGGILFAQGDYAEAEKRFTHLLQDYPESEWRPQAAFGIAACLDAQGKTNDALGKYEEIRRRYASSGVIDLTKIAAARLYEASKPEEAFKLYDEVLKNNPVQWSGLGNEAGMHQEALLQKHPELAKLREPIVPPSSEQFPPLLTNRPPALTNLAQQTNRAMMLTNLAQLTNRMMQFSNLMRSATNPAARVVTNVAPTNLPLLISPPATAPAPAPTPQNP